MKRVAPLVILCVAFISLASAIEPEYYFKFGEAGNLRKTVTFDNSPSALITCNISSEYPNESIYISNERMTNNHPEPIFNYTFQNLTISGLYRNTIWCSVSGINDTQVFYMQVTGNGAPPPSEFVIVLFVLLFLALIFYMVFSMLSTLYGLKELNVSLQDVTFNLSGYLVLLGLYVLQKVYMGDVIIDSWIALCVQIGAWTNIIVPLCAYVISIIWGGLKETEKVTR